MSDSEKPKSWKERKQPIKNKWLVPIFFTEWLCEWLSYFLGQWAIFDILRYAGRLTVLVAVIFYFKESGSRQKAKHYQAWQVINAAQGKTGSGGRIYALQDLYRDGISLAGVDISRAHLLELKLENADLRDANLAGAILARANLPGANLWNANLAGAYLSSANLTAANLSGAVLSEAYLRGANLKEIKNWRDIKSIEHTNTYDINNPPDGFIKWAKERGAVEIEDYDEWLEYREKIRQEKTKEK